jgi:hypothetical protein
MGDHRPGGFASSPDNAKLLRGIVGAVGLEVKTQEKPGKSPQFDHESIRPRVFSFSTFYIAKFPGATKKILN